MVATKLINIGFNVSNPLHDDILKISQEIRDIYKSDWYIDDQRYHLHFPMYLISIPVSNEKLIEEISHNYLEECKREKIKITGMFFNTNGLLMLKFQLTDQILDLHKHALEYFNPLRGGTLREKYQYGRYMESLSVEDRKNVQEYGSEYVFDKYIPHITIARIKDEGQQKEIENRYSNILLSSSGVLDRLQVHTAVFSENKQEDRTILLFDKEIV